MQQGLTTAATAASLGASVAHRLKANALKARSTHEEGSASGLVVAGKSASLPWLNTPLNALQQNTLRVVAQYLRDLGFTETVESLVDESGCKVEDSHAVKLREAVARGRWDDALAVLSGCYGTLSDEQVHEAKVVILEEKFLDLIYRNQNVLALRLLREEYPEEEEERRATLVRMIFQSAEELAEEPVYSRYKAMRRRTQRHDIHRICARLQEILPTSFMLPPARLEELLEQSWRHQFSRCPVHAHVRDGAVHSSMVFADHEPCSENRQLFAMMAQHSLQQPIESAPAVWMVQFSPCGSLLAISSYAHTVHIWTVNRVTRRMEMDKKIVAARDSKCGVGGMAWSADSVLVATCGIDDNAGHMYVFNARSGQVYAKIPATEETCYTSVSFFPRMRAADIYTLVTGGLKGRLQVYELQRSQHFARQKFDGYRLRSVHACQDGNTIYAADTHNRVRVFRLITERRDQEQDETLFTEDGAIVSMTVHPSEKSCVLACKKLGLRLWSLQTKSLLRSFRAVDHDRHILNVSFGGFRNMFMASGTITEDGDNRIMVWKLNDSEPLTTIRGHTGTVNSVSWCPSDPQLLASGSDDHTARLWSCRPKDVEKVALRNAKKMRTASVQTPDDDEGEDEDEDEDDGEMKDDEGRGGNEDTSGGDSSNGNAKSSSEPAESGESSSRSEPRKECTV